MPPCSRRSKRAPAPGFRGATTARKRETSWPVACMASCRAHMLVGPSMIVRHTVIRGIMLQSVCLRRTSNSGLGLATNRLPRRLLFATAMIPLAAGATVPAGIDRKYGHRSSFATGQKCSQQLFAIGQAHATDALAAGHKHCNSSWCHGADMLPRFVFAY